MNSGKLSVFGFDAEQISHNGIIQSAVQCQAQISHTVNQVACDLVGTPR